MAYISELQIKVDTTQVDEANRKLQQLGQTSGNVEKAQSALANSSSRNAASTDRLLSQIDKQTKSLSTLATQQEKLNKLYKDGSVPEQQYQRYNAILQQNINNVRQKGTVVEQVAQREAKAEQARYDAYFTNVAKEIAAEERLAAAKEKAKQRRNNQMDREYAATVREVERLNAAEQKRYQQWFVNAERQLREEERLIQAAERRRQQTSSSTASLGGDTQVTNNRKIAESAEQAEERIRRMVATSLQQIPAIEGVSSAVQRGTVYTEAYANAQTRAMAATTAKARADQQSGTAAQSSAAAIAKQRDELTKLVGQIDPAAAALGKLDDQQRRLRQAYGRGLIDTDSFKELNRRIEQSRNQISALGQTTGKTAKEINFALRGLPAQFTDIVVSLQGGQAPLTVLLQQGGQLKDMFGGVVPALRAMAGYVVGLINPFTVLAAAAGVLTLAFYKGQQETSAYNKALILTGNIAGQTTSSLAESAKAIGAQVGTQRQAALALAEIAQTGRFTADQIDAVGIAAVGMSVATGQAVGDTVAEFERLAKAPADAILELNDKYHFLTAAVYDQIRSLEEQGRTQEATTLAITTYSNTLQERTKDVTENLGTIEKAWKAIAGVAKSAWDAMLNVGREDTLDDKIREAQEALELAEQTRNTVSRGRRGESSELNKRVQLARDYVQELLDQRDGEAAVAEQIARKQQIQDEAAKSYDKIRDAAKSNMSQVQRYRKELEELEKNHAKVKAAGNVSADAEKAYATAVENTTAKLKEAEAAEARKNKPKKEKAVRDDEATRRLLSLNQQQSVLEEQVQTSEKLSKEERNLSKFNQEIADLKSKRILTADQKSVLANETLLRTAYELAVSTRERITEQERLNKLKSYEANLELQLLQERQRYQDDIAGQGLGDKERQRMRERLQLEREYAREAAQLQKQLNTGQIDESLYNRETEVLKKSFDERLAYQQTYYQALDRAQGDWTNGASAAFANYLDNARNVSRQVQTLFESAFQGAEDAIVNFVTTGKLSFTDFAKSVLSDIARIATRMAATQLFSSVAGAFSGGYGALGSAVGQMATQAKGGAWSGGVQMFANGAAFTNSVVSSPTAFSHANGLGVMGEAGPEAIMPLTRSSDGSLGVKATGGGSQVIAPVSVSVVMNGDSGSAGNEESSQNGRAVQQAIEQVVDKAITSGLRPGGAIWRAMNGR